MTDSQLRQRIAYLVTHGGMYPQGRPPWLPWAVGLIVLQLLVLAAILLK